MNSSPDDNGKMKASLKSRPESGVSPSNQTQGEDPGLPPLSSCQPQPSNFPSCSSSGQRSEDQIITSTMAEEDEKSGTIEDTDKGEEEEPCTTSMSMSNDDRKRKGSKGSLRSEATHVSTSSASTTSSGSGKFLHSTSSSSSSVSTGSGSSSSAAALKATHRTDILQAMIRDKMKHLEDEVDVTPFLNSMEMENYSCERQEASNTNTLTPETVTSLDQSICSTLTSVKLRRNWDQVSNATSNSAEIVEGEEPEDPLLVSRARDSSGSSIAGDEQVRGDSWVSSVEMKNDRPRVRKFSKNHQKRFHRRFPTIDESEGLIDWFNCALVSDILLQGYLYVSEGHFSFYCNIFGYKKEIVIPVSSVQRVSKEKTAKIFPNAIGIEVLDKKYIFGSFLSRESAYKLMQDVWRSSLDQIASGSVERIRLMREDSKEEEEEERDVAPDQIPRISGIELNRSLTLEYEVDLQPNQMTEPEGHLNAQRNEDEDFSSDSMEEDSVIGRLKPLEQPTPKTGFTLSPSVKGKDFSSGPMSFSLKGWRSNLGQESTLLLVASIGLVLLLMSAGYLLFRAHELTNRLQAYQSQGLTLDMNRLRTCSNESDCVSQGVEWSETAANLLNFHVKRFANVIDGKLTEVTSLRKDLESLMEAVSLLTETPSASVDQMSTSA